MKSYFMLHSVVCNVRCVLCVNYLFNMKHKYNITFQIMSGETGNGFLYHCTAEPSCGLKMEYAE